MSLTVVGTVGVDSIYTASGSAENVLGGSVSYFALAASYFTHVNVVSIIGTDLDENALAQLRRSNIDTSGITPVQGSTFRWGGRYHEDMNHRETLYTELGTLAEFQPVVPEQFQNCDVLFLANLTPLVQLSVLKQTKARLRALDTMNFWIESARQDLVEVMRLVDIVIIAEDELRQFAGVQNLRQAARAVFDLGPNILVVKMGSYGSALLTAAGDYFTTAAFPIAEAIDPTGAGDSFAGGFLGYIAEQLELTGEMQLKTFKQALLYGSCLGAFACEGFGLSGFDRLSKPDIANRYRDLQEITHIQ